MAERHPDLGARAAYVRSAERQALRTHGDDRDIETHAAETT